MVPEETPEEELKEEDIRAIRIDYLDKFIQITKTWIKILHGGGSVTELEGIRRSIRPLVTAKKEKREKKERKEKEEKKRKKKAKKKKKKTKKSRKKSK